MGRPLNKKFFGDDTGLLQATLAWLPGAGSAVACHILRQRSNLKYEVANEATVASNVLVVGAKYIITTVGSEDWTVAGAPNSDLGTRFTATATTTGGATGAAREFAVCKLQRATPAADFQMHIEVQAENADTPAEATFTFDTNGSGEVSAVTLTDGGYGYWTNGATFNITVASDAGYVAGTESVVTLTVANGSIVSVTFTAGAGYSNNITGDPIVAGDVLDQDANPPLEYARIINSRVVKTYEDGGGIYGNTYPWPTGVSGRQAGVTEADIDVQA